MAWQLVAIWAITAVTLIAFIADEIAQRRKVSGRPLRRVRGNELHVARAARRPPEPSREQLRRARLRSIGF